MVLTISNTSNRLFFFFQAEDGIRDVAVTGVQTCALPICRRAGRGEEKVAMRDACLVVVDAQNDFMPGGALAVPGGDEVVPVINRLAARSEERRVGKECRSRWSPYH